MDANLMIGSCAMVFGLVTLVARFVAPNSQLFSKLGRMQERFGAKAGLALHVVTYTVMPLVVGSVLVASALVGRAP